GGAEHRDELLAGLVGRVVEVGAGNGLNFAHYPDTVTEVVAVEPEPYLRKRALQAAEKARVPIRVLDGTAEALPGSDGEFDAAVASLMLCSVPDQAAALDELHRVIRPGGELRFYEHVRATTSRLSRLQRATDLIWPHLAGGCHTSRDTTHAITGAGFEITQQRDFTFLPAGRVGIVVAPHVIGRARRP
ncbi:MAG TPA: class I SAM-dependent methyltransferase, partial [Acidimicrobiia bacterium]